MRTIDSLTRSRRVTATTLSCSTTTRHFASPGEGEVLKGYVLKVTDKEVIVDFGYKSEGLVPIEQFRHPDGSVHVKPATRST